MSGTDAVGAGGGGGRSEWCSFLAVATVVGAILVGGIRFLPSISFSLVGHLGVEELQEVHCRLWSWSWVPSGGKLSRMEQVRVTT